MAKVIALDGVDFLWDEEIIDKVKEIWKQGLHISDIAEKVKRNQVEVLVLLLDLELKKEIPRRKLGIFG